MRHWLFLIIIVIFAMLQITFFDCVRIFNVKPDLLLISTVITSLFFNIRGAIFLGIFSGMLKDILSANAFGINTLIFALWALVIVKLSRKISIDNNYTRLALMFIVTLLHCVIIRLILLYFGVSIPLGVFLRIAILESLYTALTLPIILKGISPALLVRK